MYAVIQTGGKQYRVAPGDTIRIERVSGDVGEKVTFGSVTFDASDPSITFFSSVCTASTEPNVTFSPTSPLTRSIRIVSPGATRYCFPPVCMTAYIAPPAVKTNPNYRGFTPTPSTHENHAMNQSSIAPLLAGNILGSPNDSFVVAEWQDAGGPTDPPRLIAPRHVHHHDDE